MATKLVVGCNTDEDIEKAKGPTILNVNERKFIIESCKWVSTVVVTPYIPSIDLLDELGCEFYGHGDDPFFDEQGNNMLEYFQKHGRMKIVKRTTGVSTTAMTGRLLKLAETKNGPAESSPVRKDPPKQQFLSLGSRLRLFANYRSPQPTDKIVYFSASCDLFHPSVIKRIQAAK